MKGRTSRCRAFVLGDALRVTVALAVGGAGSAMAQRITRIDGQTSKAAVAAIADERVALADAEMQLGDIWRIECVPPVAPSVSGAVERIVLDNGDLPVRNVTIRDARCRFDWAGGEGVDIARTSARELILAAGATGAVREAAARARTRTIAADQVLALGKEGAVLTIEGVVKEVGPRDLIVQYQGEDRTLSRAIVCAVIFGRAGTADEDGGGLLWKLTATDGAWLQGRDLQLADGVLRIAVGAHTLSLPWAAVSRIEQIAGKVRALSRMEPLRATGGAIVTLDLPWQRDRSAMGRPLRLRGNVCEVGLGVHAPTELVFEVPAGMQRFMAVVGLDEEYGRKGDCEVVVLVAGREAFRRRMRGSDEPVLLDIRLEDARQITLRAEAGENLDIGDHVNWYEARFLR